MIHRFASLLVLFTAAGPLAAQNLEPVKLALKPTAAPVPALKYHLLPELQDQTPGNAVLLYYRAFSPEWMDHRRQPELYDKASGATNTPLADLPREELRWLLRYRMLQEVGLAARREFCDWSISDRVRKEHIGLLLPDIQAFREIGTLLAARARLEMAEGHFDKACYSLQTGFAIARHLNEGPTLIGSLVGAAITGILCKQVEDMVQAPGSPNLYWALTGIPARFIDLRKPLQTEKSLLEFIFPEF